MTTSPAPEHADGGRSRCWCCSRDDADARMVHLGAHPEVALCTRCARWAAKEAAEIEDRDRTGWAVAARDRLRTVRRGVVARGWHQHPLVGRPLRWLGRWMP